MKQAGKLLVILAWVAFLACLLLPAVQFHDESAIMGWRVGLAVISELPPRDSALDDILVFVAGIGNVVLFLSPLALFAAKRNFYPALSLLSTAFFGIAAGLYAPNSGFASGYFLWVAAFLVMALGFGVLAMTTPHNHAAQSDAAKPRGWP